MTTSPVLGCCLNGLRARPPRREIGASEPRAFGGPLGGESSVARQQHLAHSASSLPAASLFRRLGGAIAGGGRMGAGTAKPEPEGVGPVAPGAGIGDDASRRSGARHRWPAPEGGQAGEAGMRADGTERRRCARASVAGAAMLVWLCTGGPGVRLPAAGPSAGNGPAPAGGAAAQSGGTVAAGGAAAQSGGTVADGVFTADQVARGERTFREVCAACHDTVEFSGRAVPVHVGGPDRRRPLRHHRDADAGGRSGKPQPGPVRRRRGLSLRPQRLSRRRDAVCPPASPRSRRWRSSKRRSRAARPGRRGRGGTAEIGAEGSKCRRG